MRCVYFSAIHKDKKSDYTALFPGVPGCITAGGTVDEVATMAREALQSHLDVSRDCGDLIHAPLSFERVQAHKDAKGAAFFLGVSVKVESEKSTCITVTMPESLIEELDAHAKRRGLDRSAFLAQAVRMAMQA